MKDRTVLVFIFVIIMNFLYGCRNPTENSQLKDVTPEEASEPESETQEEEAVPARLTLMVYMAADNDLERYALGNLKQMENAVYEGINVLVLLDRAEGYDETDGNWTDTRLFEVVHDYSNESYIKSKRLDCPLLGLSCEKETELDMANSSVLESFIDFGKSNYEAENYALVIWGHGTGWRYRGETVTGSGLGNERAVAIDDRSSDYMCVSELGRALRNKGLNVIGFDTCFGGVFENVYELKDCSEFTVACPGVTPSTGWNYKKLLESLSVCDFSPKSVAKMMSESSAVSTTFFVNEYMTDLMSSFENFAQKLSQNITNQNQRRQTLDTLLSLQSYSYSQYPCDMYLDVHSLAAFYVSSSDAELSLSAGNLIAKLEKAVGKPDFTYYGLGVHLIPKSAANTLVSVHSADYVKNDNKTDQCAFIKQSRWWVPTVSGNSGSLLDKLFYNGV